MMKLFTFIFLTLFSCEFFSQDTIYTRNGEMIPAKVYEISQSEIKYKKATNPDGPLYVAGKNDIALIEYSNGSKEVFPFEPNSVTINSQPIYSNYVYGLRRRVNVVITPPIVIGNYRPLRHFWCRHYGWCR